jgi:DNA-binding transcriptional regulator YhcF (GntR family)
MCGRIGACLVDGSRRGSFSSEAPFFGHSPCQCVPMPARLPSAGAHKSAATGPTGSMAGTTSRQCGRSRVAGQAFIHHCPDGAPLQLPISIDASSATTLHSQIAAQLRALILDRRLAPGAPVPATRDLGRQLRVSRNTVTAAYEELISEGYLYTERAVGTFVCKTLPDTLIGRTQAHAEHRSGSLHRAMNLPLPYGGRGLTGLHRPSAPRLIADFVFGRSDARNFPERIWRKLIVECLGGAAERMSEYVDPAGIPELRQLITSRLGPTRGMVASVEQVLLVAGFQQGIDLVGASFRRHAHAGRDGGTELSRRGLPVRKLWRAHHSGTGGPARHRRQPAAGKSGENWCTSRRRTSFRPASRCRCTAASRCSNGRPGPAPGSWKWTTTATTATTARRFRRCSHSIATAASST